jgi:hypothetical protein
MCRVHAELHNEGLHRRGVVNVRDFEPERLALLDGGINFGGRAPGIVFGERVDRSKKIDGGVGALNNPDSRIGFGGCCEGKEGA